MLLARAIRVVAACATSVLGVQRNRCPAAFIAGVYHERQLINGFREDGNLGSTWFASATFGDPCC